MNVEGLVRSMGEQKLADMVEIQAYPMRMKFMVSPDESGMLLDRAEAKIMVHGVQRTDGLKHSFNIDLPTSHRMIPNQCHQCQITGMIGYFLTKCFVSNRVYTTSVQKY